MLLTGVYPLLWQLSGDTLLSLGISPAVCARDPALLRLLRTGAAAGHGLLSPLQPVQARSCWRQQHGFNKQTPELFFSDLLKQLAAHLHHRPAAPLPSCCYVIDSTGAHFYLYVWLVVLAVQLLAITLYPLVIQPLFNKVEALEDGPLRSAVESLAQPAAASL